MKSEDICPTLQTIFASRVRSIAPGTWGGTTPNFQLLVRLSEDQTELQLLLPLIPDSETSAHQEVTAAYTSLFQQADYTVLRDMLWAVFPYPLASTDAEALAIAIPSLFERHKHFLLGYFQSVTDKQMQQLIQKAKQSGRSLQATLQFLEYTYRENLLGELLEDDEQGREALLARWRAKIVQCWGAVDR